MALMTQLARERTDLSDDDLDWLQRLIADWQIIADLSFADLILWLPSSGPEPGYWAAAQVRPTTGPTGLVDDQVGRFLPRGRRELIDRAFLTQRAVRDGDPELYGAVPIRVEAVPVIRAGRVIAVLSRKANLMGIRTPSRLELAYLDGASELTAMIAQSAFPDPTTRVEYGYSPRVGDGLIRLTAQGLVSYASPNALSLYRKLGLTADLDGRDLAEVTRSLVPSRRRGDEETLSAVLGGRVARDVEIDDGQTVAVVRALPLRARADGGALILVRDVTEVRWRDRQLISKEATIREIHHRVKNNLQTVAALLRLQARRIESASGRQALLEAVRRVGSIAVVHETLSTAHEHAVDFDEVADRLTHMVIDVASARGAVRCHRRGSFGALDPDLATPLAMVLTELIQNASEHGFPAHFEGEPSVELHVTRDGEQLTVAVSDNGVGFAAGAEVRSQFNLGLSIVETLIDSELNGSLEFESAPGQGTVVRVTLGVRANPGASVATLE